jgi:uncharacterized protein RhaS with RHS repeats
MNRRYNRWWARFEQPDPYGGSYNLTDPQSFNRYSYVRNDPVNFVDPNGLDPDARRNSTALVHVPSVAAEGVMIQGASLAIPESS